MVNLASVFEKEDGEEQPNLSPVKEPLNNLSQGSLGRKPIENVAMDSLVEESSSDLAVEVSSYNLKGVINTHAVGVCGAAGDFCLQCLGNFCPQCLGRFSSCWDSFAFNGWRYVFVVSSCLGNISLQGLKLLDYGNVTFIGNDLDALLRPRATVSIIGSICMAKSYCCSLWMLLFRSCATASVFGTSLPTTVIGIPSKMGVLESVVCLYFAVNDVLLLLCFWVAAGGGLMLSSFVQLGSGRLLGFAVNRSSNLAVWFG
ncbi:hypothetical protein U1Q18_032310 [Sarracenia purpurea var. burkii]